MNNFRKGTYSFALEKHPAKKGICPACHYNGKFRHYENLSREYGKCERENACGYWIDPHKETLERKKNLKEC